MKTAIEQILERYAETNHNNLKAAPVREAIAAEITDEINRNYIIETKPEYKGFNQQEPGLDY